MSRLFDAYPRSMARLEGVKVEVTEECVGCGECVPVCPIENVRLVDGAAEIGDKCLGCGTCASACSRGCIRVTIEPGSGMHEELKRRVEAGVDIEQRGGDNILFMKLLRVWRTPEKDDAPGGDYQGAADEVLPAGSLPQQRPGEQR